jgi:hypothetical protein
LVGVLLAAAWALGIVSSASATWTVGTKAPIPPGPPNGLWGAVSCLTKSDCWVAGSATNPDGLIAERWNGSNWKVFTMPRAAGSTSEEITSIGCRNATSCIAVGTVRGLATSSVSYVWNGSAWSAGPSVAESSFTLNGVSCASGWRCLVVGDYVPYGSTKQYALAAWWNPSSSLLEPIESVRTAGGAGASLTRASCPGKGSCVTVGSSTAHGISIELVGGAWSETTMPDGVNGEGNPSPAQAADVSCLSASACVAAGRILDPFSALNGDPVLLTYDGTRWTLVNGLPIDFPAGVSCASASDCTVVGFDHDEHQIAAAAHWDGTHVTSTVVFEDPSWDSVFRAVACPPGGGCVAVGGQSVFDGPFTEAQPMMQTSSGGAFSLSTTPPPHGAGSAGLAGISCPSASNCVAVGSALPPINEHAYHGGSIAYAAHWDGSHWSAVTPKRVAGQTQLLDAVSCPTSTTCIAVGGTEPAEGFPPAYTPLAERWDGTGWSRLPVPSGVSGTWTSVSCVSATHCVALGTGQFEVWNGSTWTAQAQANASDSLSSVSCTAADACTAVGWTAGPTPGVEQWNGTAWTEQTASEEEGFDSVSCATSTTCQAISEDPVQAMGWNGTAWTTESIAVSGSETGQNYADQVDCPAARSCEAVGTIRPSGSPFADGYDGAGWQTQSLPTSLQNSGLDAVSCPSRVACFAVGSDTTRLVRYSASPTARTTAPDIGDTKATLHGVVNPQGATVRSCVFEWGATTAYGHSSPCAETVGSDFAPVQVSARVTQLVPGATYHYRLVVTSSAGGAHGSNWAFTTAADGGYPVFGNATIGDGSSSFVADYKRTNSYRLTEPGSVTQLGIYLQPTGTVGTQNIQGAIYADSFGTPGKLLGTTQSFNYSDNGAAAWWGLQFAKPLHLTAGRYWLAVLTSGTAGVAGWRYDVIPNSRVYNSNAFSAGFSDPFGAVTRDDFQMSLFATYKPDSSGSAAKARAAHATTAPFRAPKVLHERPGRVR